MPHRSKGVTGGTMDQQPDDQQKKATYQIHGRSFSSSLTFKRSFETSAYAACREHKDQ
jgi:hypothetical protein